MSDVRITGWVITPAIISEEEYERAKQDELHIQARIQRHFDEMFKQAERDFEANWRRNILRTVIP